MLAIEPKKKKKKNGSLTLHFSWKIIWSNTKKMEIHGLWKYVFSNNLWTMTYCLFWLNMLKALEWTLKTCMAGWQALNENLLGKVFQGGH